MIDPRQLFHRHHLPVFRFLRRSVRNQDVAEDLLQETFLRVVRARDQFDESGSERAWVFRIARNVLLNRRRDDARHPELDEWTPEVSPPRDPSPLERFDLDRALADIDPSHREAFLLREVGGLGYVEIASIQDCTPDAARNRIYRARTALRQALSDSPRGEIRRFPKERTS